MAIDIFLVRACVDVDKSLENEFLEMIEKKRGELVEDEELTKRGRELEKLFMVYIVNYIKSLGYEVY